MVLATTIEFGLRVQRHGMASEKYAIVTACCSRSVHIDEELPHSLDPFFFWLALWRYTSVDVFGYGQNDPLSVSHPFHMFYS